MSTLDTSLLTQALSDLLVEAYAGSPDSSNTWFIDNEPDCGILDTLRNVSAAGELSIPFWIVMMAHATIALGTVSGRWRIVHTMGSKITKLQPIGGFAAETSGAITPFTSSALGNPVSTTHVITGGHRERRHRARQACRQLASGQPDRMGVGDHHPGRGADCGRRLRSDFGVAAHLLNRCNNYND